MADKAPNKQQTRRQHWLPQASYLKHFTNEAGKATVYWLKDRDRATFYKTAEIKEIAPVNVGVEKDLYETKALPPNTIENVLANIEGAYGRVLAEKIIPHKPLNKNEHEVVAQYVSTLENRTPMQRDHVQDFINRLNETGRAVSLANNSPEAAENWTKQMEEAKEAIFGQWMATTIDMNKWSPLDFCFLIPASYVDATFITSDHPVTLVDMTSDNSPFGLNQWGKTAECIVPLTPTIALFGNRCGITGYKEIDYNMIREINNRVLRRADKMVISKSKIDEYEAKVTVSHMPQSLLLNFLKLPKNGRADKIIRRVERKEKIQALKSRVRNRIKKRGK